MTSLTETSTVPVTTPVSSSERRMAWIVTAMLTVFMVLNFADKAVLGLVAKPVMAELGLTPVQFGFIGSSFFFLFSVSAIVVGAVANRISSRWLILILTLVWSASQFPVLVGGATVLLVTRIMLGAGEGPSLPAALHAAHYWFPARERAFPSSIIAIGPTIGAALAAPILTLIIESPALGWRMAFGALGVAGLGWGVAWAIVGRDGPYQSGSVAEPVSESGASATRMLVDVPLSRTFLSRSWVFATLAGFACFWGQSALTTWLPRYIGGVLHVEPSKVGFIFALPWILGTVLMLVLGFGGQRMMRRGISARWAISGLFGLSLVASGICLILLPHATGTAAIVLMTVGWGAFLVFPMAPTAIAYLVNPHQRAAVISSLVGCASVGGVIAPAVIGWFVERAGYGSQPGDQVAAGVALVQGLDRAFLLTGILMLAAGIGAFFMIDPERDSKRLQDRMRVA